MVVITTQQDGRLEIPEDVRERYGIYPGVRLALKEVEKGDKSGILELHVLQETAQLLEEDGLWVIGGSQDASTGRNQDLISEVREERIESLVKEREAKCCTLYPTADAHEEEKRQIPSTAADSHCGTSRDGGLSKFGHLGHPAARHLPTQ